MGHYYLCQYKLLIILKHLMTLGKSCHNRLFRDYCVFSYALGTSNFFFAKNKVVYLPSHVRLMTIILNEY